MVSYNYSQRNHVDRLVKPLFDIVLEYCQLLRLQPKTTLLGWVLSAAFQLKAIRLETTDEERKTEREKERGR